MKKNIITPSEQSSDSDEIDDDSDIAANIDVTKNIKKRVTLLNTKRLESNLKHQDYVKKNIKVKPTIRYSKQEINYSSWISYNFSIVFFISFLVFILGIVAFYVFKEDQRSDVITVNNKLKDVQRTLKSLMLKYKNQERNLWENIYASIKMIIENPTKPSIIVLLADKWHPLDCLVKLVANVSSNALNTDSLLLTPENFDANTGSVIQSMSSKATDNKAIIIWDLLNINVEALKAFHNLCDTINPLIKEVIFIITIIADNYDNRSNPIEFIEKEIWKKLNGKIKDDAIFPLITRITDGAVLKVNSEPISINCPLPTVSKTGYKSLFL